MNFPIDAHVYCGDHNLSARDEFFMFLHYRFRLLFMFYPHVAPRRVMCTSIAYLCDKKLCVSCAVGEEEWSVKRGSLT